MQMRELEESPVSEPEEEQNELDDDDYAAAAASKPHGLRGGATFRRWDSSKIAASEPEGGSNVVYSKDNVAIHPSQSYCHRINGRLRLIEYDSALFLSWMPYKPNNDGAHSPWSHSQSWFLEKDNMYSIKAVPICDVRSIHRHAPALGWQYIIVVLSSGLAFPPLYFYRGGVREFLTAMKQNACMTRSADNANVFLLNDFQDPFQKSLSSLNLPGIVSFAKKTSFHDPVITEPLTHKLGKLERVDKVTHDSSIDFEDGGPSKHKSHDPTNGVSYQVLEKLSLFTKFARDTTLHLFGESGIDALNGHEEIHQEVHGLVDSIVKPDEHWGISDNISIPVDPLEEKISLLWANERKQPLSIQEWHAFLDSKGRIKDSTALRERVFYGGVEPNLRKKVWKFLLGYHVYESTYDERNNFAATKKEEYEEIKYQWQRISAKQAKRFTKFRERKGLIDKDVVRTDRSVSYYEGDDNPNIMLLRDILLTYSFYNFDLGYCQGMSDLLSPILYIMEDEAESFWCFVALLDRLGPNFNRDQSGMHAQLLALSKLMKLLDRPLHDYLQQADCLNYFFCFRWILIQFKREFEYDQIMCLWEILWTHHLSEHFHLYLCVAALKTYRKKIMGEQMDFDTLLKFINERSGNLDMDQMIKDAEALCLYAGEDGAACIPIGTPPSLPVETDTVLLYIDEDEVL